MRDEKELEDKKGDEEEEEDVNSMNSPTYSTRQRTTQSPKEKGTPSPLAGGATKKRGRGKR